MVTIDIFNMSEDVWPFIAAISDEKKRAAEIAENSRMGDREIWCLAGEDGGIAICPKPVAAEFLKYYEEITGRAGQVWVPDVKNGSLCQDIVEDERFMERLVNLGKKEGGISLVAYTASEQFYNLVRALRERGVVVVTPEAPAEKDAWTVDYFGSKSGVRRLGVPMAAGGVYTGIKEAAKKAEEIFLQKGGVVIKTNKGHSGMGVMIIRPGELAAERGKAEEAILARFSQNAYWQKFPIVVEELVEVDEGVGRGFPDGEFKVGEDGGVKMLYWCGVRVFRNGEFAGIEIGSEVAGKKIARQMEETGLAMGQRYAKEGYRGYFDVDFAAGADGKLYVMESNVRRTGGTHVYALAKRLLGEDFMDKAYVLSNNWYKLSGPTTFGEMRGKIKTVAFNKQKKEGVVIAAENTLAWGRLAYVVLAKDKKRAEEIEEKMQKLVG